MSGKSFDVRIEYNSISLEGKGNYDTKLKLTIHAVFADAGKKCSSATNLLNVLMVQGNTEEQLLDIHGGYG